MKWLSATVGRRIAFAWIGASGDESGGWWRKADQAGATGAAPGGPGNALSGRAEVAVQAQAIHGDVHIHTPVASPDAVPRQLPAAVGQFVNRTSELSALDTLIAQQADPSRRVPMLSTVTGGPGVGKTALAVQWAHRVRDRFPDGELYVNLRGYEQGAPVTPAQALDGFLRTHAVPAAGIPPTPRRKPDSTDRS